MELAIARAVSPFLKDVKPKDILLWPVEKPKQAEISDVFSMLKGLSLKEEDGD